MSAKDEWTLDFCDGTSSESHSLYPGFRQETTILSRGSILKQGALSLPCDILWERDTAVTLRDGTKIYVDIYRQPRLKMRLPVIISAGPFGKNGGWNRKFFDESPFRTGTPRCTLSSLEKFEGLDPAYWCLHGYALVHSDPRGSWQSEGDTYINSRLDGQDNYDLVEWLASLPWCNGRISYAGNSWLSQTQWFVGAEQPPHLACLAPWEGWNDLYNDDAMRGGIPNPDFQQFLVSHASPSLAKTEDIVSMAKRYPCWHEYWDARRAQLNKITIPLYITASWTNGLHTRGTFQGYTDVSSTEKWLRVHNSHEWPDLYYPHNVEDLRKFFDHYLKGVQNDWIHTPKVRLSILNPGHSDIVNRPEQDFPLSRRTLQKLYLDCGELTMRQDPRKTEHRCLSFDARTEASVFSYRFVTRTEWTGYSALHIYVEAVDADDVDLYVSACKLDEAGTQLKSRCVDVGYLQPDPEAEWEKLDNLHSKGDKSVDMFFNSGPNGMLRASHRELDHQRSSPDHPIHTHRAEDKLRPGQIVPLAIELWPYGWIFEAGEVLQLTVSGCRTWPQLLPFLATPNYNRGRVVLHSGGEYDSHLLIPTVL